MSEASARIAENLAVVQQRVAAAAERSGRAAADVTLVAVTKYVGDLEVAALIEAGCRQLGESRPQELWRKAKNVTAGSVSWHLIGHLQRNKVRRTLPLTALVHSCDSLRLLAEINRVAAETETVTPVLLETNISGETAKHGFAPEMLEEVLPQIAQLQYVAVKGLMAMAGRAGDRDQARRDFSKLRELRDRLTADCPPSVTLLQLSMGMSGDFEVAIEEGATLVRVGSALFEGALP